MQDYQDVNMTGIIMQMKEGLKNADPRYTVMDREHIMDTHTGYEFHFYDDHYKVTKDGDVVYTSKQVFDHAENQAMRYIHKMLSQHFDKVDLAKALENRKTMYDFYMNPTQHKSESVDQIGMVDEVDSIGSATESASVTTY